MRTRSLIPILFLLSCSGGKADSAASPGGRGPGGGSAGGQDSGDPGQDTGPARIEACDRGEVAPLDAETCIDAASCTWRGSQGYAYFGYDIHAGGDFDGDGHADVAIGSPVEDVIDEAGNLIADAGTVTLLSGGRIGEPTAGVLATFQGSAPSAQAGTTVLLPGDMDGDGLSELLLGARGESIDGLEYAGAAYLVRGRTLGDSAVSLSAATRISGESTLARVGTTLGFAGDTDGDGLADALLQGEMRTLDTDGDEIYAGGRAYLLRGSTSLPADLGLADADARFLSEGTGDAAGLGLAGGDIDGDGYSDVAIGAPYAHNRRGRVYILPGGPGSLEGEMALGDAPVQLSGTSTYDAYGWTLGMGDVTGDGIAELAIGVPLDDPGDTPNAGRVHLYGGGPGVFSSSPDLLTSWAGDFDEHQLGTGLHLGADLDGDGTGDLLMGAVSAWRGLVTKGGRIYVAPGRSEGWPAPDTRAATARAAVHGSSVKDSLGRASAAADLDGDGAAELITGSGYTDTGSNVDVGSVHLFWGGAFDE